MREREEKRQREEREREREEKGGKVQFQISVKSTLNPRSNLVTFEKCIEEISVNRERVGQKNEDLKLDE